MKMLSMLMLTILSPSIAAAGTVCRAVEFPEYFEVVCTGDEKAVPSVEANSATAGTSAGVKSSPDGPLNTFDIYTAKTGGANLPPGETIVITKKSLQADVTGNYAASVRSSTETAAAPVHRQGRQKYSNELREAIAARLNLILK